MAKSLSYTDVIHGEAQDYEKVGKVSSQSVEKGTGKSWKTWIPILEKAGARNLTHGEIAELLKKKYRLTPWWQQGVALGFQIATGRRRVGQDARGKYTVTATKSLPLDVKAVWKQLLSPRGIEIWLRPLSPVRLAPKSSFETKDGYFGEIRTLAPNRKIRMSWQDPSWEKPTVLEVFLVPRPGKKSILAFSHTGIPDDKTREIIRARWRGAADRIAETKQVETKKHLRHS
jgi:uncharacterized protein YndB with AHSA1/START domain